MIQEYTDIIKAIESFKQSHADVFEAYESMLEAKNKVEASLKEWAQENGDAENETVKIVVARPYSKWFDVETLKANKPAWVLLKKAGAVTETIVVDKEIMEILAREEKVSRELMASAYRETALSPRITIKLLK